MKKLIHIPTLRIYKGFFEETKAESFINKSLEDSSYIYCFEDRGIEWFSFVQHQPRSFGDCADRYIKKRKEEFMWVNDEEV